MAERTLDPNEPDHHAGHCFDDPTGPLPPPDPTGSTPKYIGKYRISRLINGGGQGTVYEALQPDPTDLTRPLRVVAIKVMNHPAPSEAAARRFRDEYRIVAKLRHPGIVHFYEAGLYSCGPEGSRPFYVMEYVPGARGLTDYADNKKLDLEDRLRLLLDVCEVVAYAHKQNVIHGDLKPANILIDPSFASGVGTHTARCYPKLIDFGLARTAVSDLVNRGHVAGTLQYMSPEQFTDPETLDERSDVYALGIIAYELLTRGKLPYRVPGRNFSEARSVVCDEDPVPLGKADPNVDEALEEIVMKALEKDRDRRWDSVHDMAGRLAAFVGQPARTARLRPRSARLRHGVPLSLTVVLLAALLVELVGGPIIYRATSADSHFQKIVMSLIPQRGWGPSLSLVRIIEIRDDGNPDALPAKAPNAPQTPDDAASEVRLFALLLRKLLPSGVAVVVGDVLRPGQPGPSDELVEAGQLLRANGAHLVIGTRSWRYDDHGRADLDPRMLPFSRPGGVSASFDPSAWGVDLAVQPEGADPVPSLALAAFAAHRHPDLEPVYRFFPGILEIRYCARDPASPLPSPIPRHTDAVRMTALSIVTENAPDFGLRVGDVTGYYVAIPPSEPVYHASTFRLDDVLVADDDQLQSWFGGMIVLVVDARAGRPRFTHPDGRQLPGMYGHAAAVEMLFRDTPVRAPGWAPAFALTLFGSCLGALCVPRLLATSRSVRWRRTRLVAIAAARLVGLTVLLVSISLAAFAWGRSFYNPLFPVGALLLSGVVLCVLALSRHIPRRWREAR